MVFRDSVVYSADNAMLHLLSWLFCLVVLDLRTFRERNCVSDQNCGSLLYDRRLLIIVSIQKSSGPWAREKKLR